MFYLKSLKTGIFYSEEVNNWGSADLKMEDSNERGLNNFEITDFNDCDMPRLKSIDNKIVHYKLLLNDATSVSNDIHSNYSGDYEHVLLSDHDCFRVISDVTREGNKFFLCRNQKEVGIPRKERLPEVGASKIAVLYQVVGAVH